MHSAIPLKELTLKVGCQDFLYHQVTTYGHVIVYSQLAFVVFDMETMINYLDARKLWHVKKSFWTHTLCSTCHRLYYILLH